MLSQKSRLCLRISWEGVCLEEWSWSLTVLVILELVSSGLFPGWFVCQLCCGEGGSLSLLHRTSVPWLSIKGIFPDVSSRSCVTDMARVKGNCLIVRCFYGVQGSWMGRKSMFLLLVCISKYACIFGGFILSAPASRILNVGYGRRAVPTILLMDAVWPEMNFQCKYRISLSKESLSPCFQDKSNLFPFRWTWAGKSLSTVRMPIHWCWPRQTLLLH